MAQNTQQLARITPVKLPVSTKLAAPRTPSAREKAAIIVRALMVNGDGLSVAELPEYMQAALTEQMGQMRIVDRATMLAVVEEFLAELDDVALTFPGDINGALEMMDGHISASAANRLRRMSGASSKADPWDRLVDVPIETLLPLLESESNEVLAVALSRLPVQKSADMLSKIPGDRARKIVYTISMTRDTDPETVRRIGQAIVTQLDAIPIKAFIDAPSARVGSILNVAPSLIRDDVLTGLDGEDAFFAEQVRKTLFTFGHIPERIAPRDLPRVVRVVAQPVLVTALVAASKDPQLASTADFFLNNLSQRMVQTIKEEMENRGKVKEKDGEAAMSEIIAGIRRLESSGEITLKQTEEEGE